MRNRSVTARMLAGRTSAWRVFAVLALFVAGPDTNSVARGLDARDVEQPVIGRCTNRDMLGAFGFFGTGSVLASPVTGLAGQFGRVGRFTSDGNGHLAFDSRAAFNGIVFHQDFFGTYEMNPDCTFIAKVTLPFSHPSITPFTLVATFFGTMTAQGNEMYDLFADPPGVVIHGRGKKQLVSECRDRDLAGSYQMNLAGSTVDLGFPLPFAGAGVLEADGRGRIEGKFTSNTGGFAVPSTFTGTSTVAPDCSFELAYCIKAADGETCLRNYAVHGVFTNNGESAYIIVLDPVTSVMIGELRLR